MKKLLESGKVKYIGGKFWTATIRHVTLEYHQRYAPL